MFIDENETPESWWVSAVLKTIRAVALVFDILTFPVHLIVQRPWRKRALSRRIKARIIQTTQNSVTVRSVSSPCDLHLRLIRDGVTSMESMLRAAAARWADRPCLGTRTVLSEEDEPQPNGRVFKKFNMGPYEWRTYVEVEREARQFGAGLRELGCAPRHNVVMFAETRAEWMLAAHGCFKQSIPVVTIYATLGDEAIAHGINETDVSTVITTYDLLPKFKKILAKTPKVDTIIYMEDQLKTIDREGYKPGIKIIGYKEVVLKGASSKIEPVPPSPSDTAIIMYTSGSTGVPKGVVLSHRNMLATLKAFADAMPIFDGDVLMGFLPLAHVFELLAENLCMIGGVPIGYSTPLTMLDTSSKIMKGTKGDATILQPTCITTVPAHARPDTGSPEWNSKPVDSQEPASHDASYDDSSYQESGHQESPSDRAAYERLSALMTDFGKAMDTHLTPLMSKMAEHKQKDMKSIGLNGMASYLNYMYLMIQEYEHEKEKGVNSTSHDPSTPRNNEIILQFDSPYNVDWPFIHDTHEEHKVAN